MLEKVRTSQSEILMINKNLASSLKRQRGEIAELQNRGALSSTIIESLLVQAIALEQAMQIHLDHCYGNDTASISVKPSRFNQSSHEQQPF